VSDHVALIRMLVAAAAALASLGAMSSKVRFLPVEQK
jgi:hypothetical protein